MTFEDLVWRWRTRGFTGVTEEYGGPLLIPLAPWDRPSAGQHTISVGRQGLGAVGPRLEDDEDPTASGVSMLELVHSALGGRMPAPGAQVLVAIATRRGGAGVSIGRSAQNDVVIDQESVSRFHATLRGGGISWSIEDARSRNGTLRNGVPVGTGRGTPLRVGDVLTFGEAACLYCPVDPVAIDSVLAAFRAA